MARVSSNRLVVPASFFSVSRLMPPRTESKSTTDEPWYLVESMTRGGGESILTIVALIIKATFRHVEGFCDRMNLRGNIHKFTQHFMIK